MRKRLLLFVLTLTLVVLSFVRVSASSTTNAVAIDVEPESTSEIRAILDDTAFDYSDVSFNSPDTTEQIQGKAQLFKIFLTSDAQSTTNPSAALSDLVGETGFWFSAYCLDGNAKFPEMGIVNNEYASTIMGLATTMPDQVLGAVTLSAFANQSKFYTQIANYVKGKDLANYNPTMVYQVEGSDEDMTFDFSNFIDQTSYVPCSTANATATGTLVAAIQGNGSATVKIKSIKFSAVLPDEEDVEFTGAVMNAQESKTGDYYEFTFSGKDILFDNYSMTKIGNNDYNHALWIIEHSYPSMTLTDFITVAGANYETLKNEVAAVTGHTDAALESDVENYVYHTIQYAIWKANGYLTTDSDDKSVKLGDTLTFNGSTTSQLQVIYNYLIQDRDEYTNYGNNSYDNQITLDISHNDDVEEKGDYYIYGPYTAKYNVINPSTMTLTTDATTGVTIVDADGNELTNVRSGQAFYIKCKKSAKITNLDLTLDATGKTYKDNAKGTIYYANYALNQNLLSGASYTDVTQSKTFSLTYNPKTGVTNVAVVFVITLVAFSLGYMVLSYKNKPVELN